MPGPPPASGSGSDSNPDSGKTRRASFRKSAETFCDGLRDHFHARRQLLELELREAAGFAARKAALFATAAILAFFGYALLLGALVSAAGRWLQHQWPGLPPGAGWQIGALVCGILHLALVFLILLRLSRKNRQPLFEYTRAEFRKDAQWLHQKQSGKEKNASR